MLFLDRQDAGLRLGEALSSLRSDHPIVVGLPRGGVPVAAEVARALDAPLDVLVVRKLGCPWQPELGLGAIGEGGVIVLNRELISDAGVARDEIEEVERRERVELERRVRRYRGGRGPTQVQGRTVIVVDDGIATGSTARAGVMVLRARGAARVVLAAPVAPAPVVRELRGVADDVVTLDTPADFLAIGQFYVDFSPTTDDEVAECLAGAPQPISGGADDPATSLDIELPAVRLAGDLTVPPQPIGVVLFAHGSGSSRKSPRNRFVARALNDAGLATVLFDLLTSAEEIDRANVFDIGMLAERLVLTTYWVRARREVGRLPVGYFGASTGAAAALWAAALLGDDIGAVVSRGGRPDLAVGKLAAVRAPTLLIVGGHDEMVLEWNREAQEGLTCPNKLEIVPGATHLFEESGALEEVAHLARDWFARHLRGAARAAG